MKDRLWTISKIEAGKSIYLGTVKAPHHPLAMLRAFKKFKIVKNSEQRKISARLWA